jgi:hypothetical protein
MYPDNFYSSTFTLLADAEVGKHFYWNIAGFLVRLHYWRMQKSENIFTGILLGF